MKNRDNVISLVSKGAEGEEVGKKEVLEFLQHMIDDIKDGKREPFDRLVVLGHTWDADEDGFTVYMNRLGVSSLEALSTIEVAKTLLMDDILN